MSDTSDHFGTFSKIEGLSCEDTFPDVFYRKSFLNDSEWNNFNEELNISLKPIMENKSLPNCNVDVNVTAKIVTDTYRKLIDKYMPLRKLSNNKRKK